MGPERLAEGPRDQRLDRLIFLTDGIYAIAITLLAIELILPETASELAGDELRDALWDRRYEVLAYVASFVFIGNFWVGQVMLLRHVRRFDGRLLWLVLLQLLFVAFMPFPTSVIGRHPSEAVAQVFYFGTVTMTAWTLAALWFYTAGHRRLVDASLSDAAIRQGHRASLGVAGAFTVLTVLVAVGLNATGPVLVLGSLLAVGGILMGIFARDPDDTAAAATSDPDDGFDGVI